MGGEKKVFDGYRTDNVEAVDASYEIPLTKRLASSLCLGHDHGLVLIGAYDLVFLDS